MMPKPPSLKGSEDGWDVFISHASEDKETLVRPLAEELRARDVTVWYDEFSLRLGDSLSRSIARGIARSRYGLVVLSSAFFEKDFTLHELTGLLDRGIHGELVIIPVWFGVTRKDVSDFDPTLADRVALVADGREPAELADALFQRIDPIHHASDVLRRKIENGLQEVMGEVLRLHERGFFLEFPYHAVSITDSGIFESGIDVPFFIYSEPVGKDCPVGLEWLDKVYREIVKRHPQDWRPAMRVSLVVTNCSFQPEGRLMPGNPWGDLEEFKEGSGVWYFVVRDMIGWPNALVVIVERIEDEDRLIDQRLALAREVLVEKWTWVESIFEYYDEP